MKYLITTVFFISSVYATNPEELSSTLTLVDVVDKYKGNTLYNSHQIRLKTDSFSESEYIYLKEQLESLLGVNKTYIYPANDKVLLENLYLRSLAYDSRSSLPILSNYLNKEDIIKKWRDQSYIKIPYQIKDFFVNKELDQFYNTIIHLDSFPKNIDELFIKSFKLIPMDEFNSSRYLLQYEDFYYLNTHNTKRFAEKLNQFYQYGRQIQNTTEKGLFFYDLAQCYKDMRDLKSLVSSNLISN